MKKGANQWLELIGTGGAEQPPKDFKTMKQIQEETGFSRTTVWNRLKKLEADGRVEMKRFRSKVRCQALPHYRIK